MMNSGMTGWWWMIGWGLLVVIGIVLLAVVAVRLLSARHPNRSGQDFATRSTARQVLDERYARGDLTNDEYHERVRTIGQGNR